MIIELKLKFLKTPNQLWLAAWEIDTFKWEKEQKKVTNFILNTLNIYKNKENLNYVVNENSNCITFDLSGKPFIFYELQNIFNDYLHSVQVKRILE